MCLQYHICDFFSEQTKTVLYCDHSRASFLVLNSHKLMICVGMFWKSYEMIGNVNAIKLRHQECILSLTFYDASE